jgi:hypothetical protein
VSFLGLSSFFFLGFSNLVKSIFSPVEVGPESFWYFVFKVSSAGSAVSSSFFSSTFLGFFLASAFLGFLDFSSLVSFLSAISFRALALSTFGPQLWP